MLYYVKFTALSIKTIFRPLPKGPHPRQRFSIATAICSQIAVAVDGLPTHAVTDLFNLSQFILINIITYIYIIVN